MKIVVIGSQGQLGKELKKVHHQLTDTEWVFTQRHEIDLMDAKSLDLLNTLQADVVVNCAAYTKVDLAEREIEHCWESNALGVGRLAKKCHELGCWLIHVSSDYVYHHNPGRPFKEDDPLRPRSIYAASKAAGETFIQHFHDQYIILRTSWLYGNEGPNFVKTMVRLAQTQTEIKVVNDQLGAPTFAEDLAKGIKKIIRTLKEGTSSDVKGVYHFANEGIVSWCGFASEIMHISHASTQIVPIPTKDYPLPAARPGWSVMSLGKLKKVFDIYPPHWRISLKRYLSA